VQHGLEGVDVPVDVVQREDVHTARSYRNQWVAERGSSRSATIRA
jgi:hypothetical protein